MMIDEYVRLLERREHFAQAAYRDGEWKAILGYVGANVDGTDYDRELGAALAHTLLAPVGQWCAFWPGDSQPHVHKEARAWLQTHAPDVVVLNDCAIRRANETGRARPFFAAVRERSVVLVGGDHLGRAHEAVARVIGSHTFYRVHPTSSWTEADRAASAVIDLVGHGADLVLFAAGMGSNLMIHRLWPSVKDRATLLDVGAILDPYAGRLSRRVYRDPAWKTGPMLANLV